MKKITRVILIVVFALCLTLSLTACNGDGDTATSITNLTYNGETVTWTKVKNAKSYKIKINNGGEKTVQQADSPSYQYDAEGEDFDFSIEAVVKEGSDKNPKYSIKFRNLGKVQDITLEDGVLTWTQLANVDGYQIKFNGDILDETVPSNTYTTEDAGSFNYAVRAIKSNVESDDGNNGYYAVWSDNFIGTILSAPTNIQYDSEKFTWASVPNAASYVVQIGNEEFTTNTTQYVYAAGIEDFEISVKAVGNNTTHYGSKYSAKKTYTYIEKITSLDVVNGVLVWNAPDNAAKYKIKINDIVNPTLLTASEYSALVSGQSYRIQVMPLGSSDFFFSQWSNEITVNIMQKPTVTFDNNAIQWQSISGAAGYTLRISKGGEVKETLQLGSEVFAYSQFGFTEAGTYTVEVKATALTGTGFYESAFSTAYSVTRLAAPTNKSVTNNPTNQHGQVGIAFTPATKASGYFLLADGVQVASITSGSTINVDINQLQNTPNESVVNFQVFSKGGNTGSEAILDSLNSLDFTVTKLATPQDLAINGDRLSWSTVNNTSKYIITINGNRTEVTTNYMLLYNLAAGAQEIYVQAMGDSSAVISSSYSNRLNLTKLATPGNINVNTSGIMSWDPVSNATAYKVILGSTNYDANSNNFDIKGYLSFIPEGAGVQISVFAIGTGANIIDSNPSATKTISRMNRPSNIGLSGDNLIWNPSSVNGVNATGYKLYINDVPQELSGASYALSNFAAGNYTVKVVALGNNISTFDSPESNTFSFTKLAAITEVTKNDGKYEWAAVSGVAHYEVKFSNDTLPITVTTNSVDVAYDKAGIYQVTIRAIGNGSTIASGNAYSFSQEVKAISDPVRNDNLEYTNSFKIEKSGNQIIVTVNANALATGYKFIIGGVGTTTLSTSYSYVMTTIGANYSVQVQILGGVFDNDGIFYIDSNPSTVQTITYS